MGSKALQAQWKVEKTRIQKLQWWDQVKALAGFPADPTVWHLHPVGVVGNFMGVSNNLVCTHCGKDITITPDILKAIFPRISNEHANQYSVALTASFIKYKINTCARASHFFGQSEVECVGFTAFRENLNYSNGDHLWNTYRSSLIAGLQRMHPTWTLSQIETYSKTHLIHNDHELGEVLFGDNEHPGQDYRGRGLLQMTWLETYKKYRDASGVDVDYEPNKVQDDPHVAADSSAWYWSSHSINESADTNNVKGVTKKINPALKGFTERKDAAKRAFAKINGGSQSCKQEWDSKLTGGNGW
jgi:predicted chitinase